MSLLRIDNCKFVFFHTFDVLIIPTQIFGHNPDSQTVVVCHDFHYPPEMDHSNVSYVAKVMKSRMQQVV